MYKNIKDSTVSILLFLNRIRVITLSSYTLLVTRKIALFSKHFNDIIAAKTALQCIAFAALR